MSDKKPPYDMTTQFVEEGVMTPPDPEKTYTLLKEQQAVTGLTILMKQILLIKKHPELFPSILQIIRKNPDMINVVCNGWNAIKLAIRMSVSVKDRGVFRLNENKQIISDDYSPDLLVMIAEKLVDAGAEFDVIDNSYGYISLHDVVERGNAGILKLYLDHGADPTVPYTSYNTYVISRIYNDDKVDMARLLLEHGANVNHASKEGITILMDACTRGSVELVKLYLEYNVNVNATTNDNYTALMYAFMKVYFHKEEKNVDAIVKLLLDTSADLNICNTQKHYGGKSALAFACSYSKDDSAIMMLDAGADPTLVDYTGNTILMDAAVNGCAKTVERILTMGSVDINVQHMYGETALMSACRNSHYNIVKMLLEAGADPCLRTKDGDTIIKKIFPYRHMRGEYVGRVATLKVLLRYCKMHDIDLGDLTCYLLDAVSSGERRMAELLLEYGVRPDGPVVVEESDNDKLLNKLLEVTGQPVASPTSVGDTPLMIAAKNDHDHIVELLLTHGSNKSIMNSDGKTALDIAKENNFIEVVELLTA